MEVYLLGMTPVIFMYKLLGGFPFIWTSGADTKKSRVTVDSLHSIKRNKKWMAWSIIFGSLIVSYFSYGGIGFIVILNKSATTFMVMQKFNDLVNMITTILLRIHMLGQAPALAKALTRMHTLCRTHGFTGKPYYTDKNIWFVMGNHLFGFMCICAGNIAMAVREKQFSFVRFGNIFKASVKPLVFNVSMMMYSSLIRLQATAYNNFFDIVGDVERLSPPQVNSWTHSAHRNKAQHHPLQNPLATTTRINFEKAKVLLADLYDSQNMIKNYFQFLVGLSLLQSTISSIVSCFSVSIQERQELPDQIASLGLIVMTFFPLFFLTNVPHALTLQKERLRVALKRIRHKRTDPAHKEEIRDLLELLEDDPGFSIGGFFILCRARIVDILSFVTTYVIILMQFRITETEDNKFSCHSNKVNATSSLSD
ncbi:uncharacterized protein [Cherax quadricarinatus]|uniref:uncharacterized protein n=1 Tax=Cherax quadricarinatus TaxID=27406 RepID=UPI0023794ECC|nr:LOW QUALITY PROTEIN: uncharacterized protein LOC128705151 [Cherax quadricarinatus]